MGKYWYIIHRVEPSERTQYSSSEGASCSGSQVFFKLLQSQ
jgi:hypothetical protein